MSIGFVGWPSIPRFNRDAIITEKLDGTNACIVITDDGEFACQSRKRLITPDSDNFGFARWAYSKRDALTEILGPGRHYGEWWGSGIQRGYGLKNGEKRFSLFDAQHWDGIASTFPGTFEAVPNLLVVPTILTRTFGADAVDEAMEILRFHGSYAEFGFMSPEGIVVMHSQSRTLYKVTFENDKGK